MDSQTGMKFITFHEREAFGDVNLLTVQIHDGYYRRALDLIDAYVDSEQYPTIAGALKILTDNGIEHAEAHCNYYDWR